MAFSAQQTNHTPWIPSRASAIDQLHPMETLSHVCDRPSIPRGNPLARLRQINHNPCPPSRTATTDNRYPMETVLHICNRPTKPYENRLIRLQQTNHAPWIVSRMVAINNLRICSQIKSTSGRIRLCCPTAFFTFT